MFVGVITQKNKFYTLRLTYDSVSLIFLDTFVMVLVFVLYYIFGYIKAWLGYIRFGVICIIDYKNSLLLLITFKETLVNIYTEVI